MGNRCCKTKVTDSIQAQSEPITARHRLFRALGCGKFVASVAVDNGINKRIKELTQPKETKDVRATSNLFLRMSISDLMRRDRDAFFSTSSLIDMLKGETGYPPEANRMKEIDEEHGGNIIVVVPVVEQESQKKNSTKADVDAPIVDDLEEQKQSCHESEVSEEKDIDDTAESIDTKQDEDKNSDEHEVENDEPYCESTKHRINNQIVVFGEVNKDRENVEKLANATASGSNIFIGESVLQNRPLSPEFFSVTQDNLYTDFGDNDTVWEIEEDIFEENSDDDQQFNDQERSCDNDANKISFIGKGEVSLKLYDIQAAISRLAYLNEGLDPIVETKDNAFKTNGDKETVNTEKIYQSPGEFTSGLGQADKIIEDDAKKQFDTIPQIVVTSYVGLEENESKESNISDFQQGCISAIDAEKIEKNRVNAFYTSTRRKSDCIPSPKVDHLVKEMKPSVSEPNVEVERVEENDDETKSCPILSEAVDQSSSLSSIKSNISLATASSLEILKSHNSRNDCVMSVYVRPAISTDEPRKIDIRATSKQVKDGTATKHVKLLQYIHIPPKLHGPIPAKSRVFKGHLYKTPSVAIHSENGNFRWIQTKGPRDLAQPNKVPTFHEPTAKTPNSRERLGLEKLQKYKIRIQCEAIERIKIDADEFPGILPPKIRDRFRQKVDQKKHIN